MAIKSICCSCGELELGSHLYLASYNQPINSNVRASNTLSSLFHGHLNSCGHTHIIIDKNNIHKSQDDNYYQYSPTTHWLTDFDAQDQIHSTHQLEKSSITGLISSCAPNLLKKNTEGFFTTAHLYQWHSVVPSAQSSEQLFLANLTDKRMYKREEIKMYLRQKKFPRLNGKLILKISTPQ